MRPLEWTPEQIKALCDGESVTIVVILKDQPPEGYALSIVDWSKSDIVIFCHPSKNLSVLRYLQHPIGSTCEVTFEQKYDHDFNAGEEMQDRIVTLHPVVITNEVKRTSEISYADVEACGHELILDSEGMPCDSTLHAAYDAEHGSGVWERNEWVELVEVRIANVG